MYKGKHFRYEFLSYASNKQLAIEAYDYDPDLRFWEDYGTVTINLEDYKMYPEPGHIFMPIYKMTSYFRGGAVADLADGAPRVFTIGPYGAQVYDIKLKDEIIAAIKEETL